MRWFSELDQILQREDGKEKMRILSSRTRRLGIAIILSVQVLISGCEHIREGQQRLRDQERTECLKGWHRSYIYENTRLFAGSAWFPLNWGSYLFTVVVETLTLPLDVPNERSYQSFCNELKATLPQEPPQYIKRPKEEVNQHSDKNIVPPSGN